MHIAIAGGHGKIALILERLLAERGDAVTGIIRNPGQAADLEAAGTPIGPHDTLIAATALRHQGTLITRNVREFSRVPGLQLLNWHE